MLNNFFKNLSIHKVGVLGTNIAGFVILVFAILIINQEYQRYEQEIVQIEEQFGELDNKSKQELLEKTKQEHKKKVMRYIIGIGGATLFMFFTIMALLRVVSYLIENELQRFIDHFAHATQSYQKIEEKDFDFSESKSLVSYANEMVADINQSRQELIELNATLEEKVKQKTLKLRRLVNAQDEFIKKSIHEINTPLSIILTNIDLLKMKNIQNQHITNIESGSKIIHNIFNDLSYMIKKDRVQYPKTRIDFSSFLKQRVNFFHEIARSNDLDFINNIQDDIFVYMSETKLQRIIDNNLSNAVKYSNSGEPIFIALWQKDKEIFFEVKTYSKQINQPEKIFDDFYRENAVKGGFGIGLNIVKDICDENSVTILLHSDKMQTQFTYIFKADI